MSEPLTGWTTTPTWSTATRPARSQLAASRKRWHFRAGAAIRRRQLAVEQVERTLHAVIVIGLLGLAAYSGCVAGVAGLVGLVGLALAAA